MIENIRYKLCCFGVDIDGPAELLCNNKSVVTNNSSVPVSVLSKGHNAIFTIRVREEEACSMITFQQILFKRLQLLGTYVSRFYKQYSITTRRNWKTGI